jgi:hypothetical protein
MALLILSPQERALLEALASRTHQAKELRRVQALLWLDQGESPSAVAKRVGVTRQTVYNWVKHFGRDGCWCLTRLQEPPSVTHLSLGGESCAGTGKR